MRREPARTDASHKEGQPRGNPPIMRLLTRKLLLRCAYLSRIVRAMVFLTLRWIIGPKQRTHECHGKFIFIIRRVLYYVYVPLCIAEDLRGRCMHREHTYTLLGETSSACERNKCLEMPENIRKYKYIKKIQISNYIIPLKFDGKQQPKNNF